MLYLQLFLSFLKVGLLGFGGGMAIISLIQEEVLSHGWMTQNEYIDIIAISQVTPGPIGMNCATYVGYTAGGIAGSLIASIAIILPSLVIMLGICYIYDRLSERWSENKVFQGIMRVIRILVVLLIAHAAWTLINPASFIDYKSWIIFGAVTMLTILPLFAKNKMTEIAGHPILLIILSGIAGYAMYG